MIKLSKKDYQEFLIYMDKRENNIIVSDYYNLYLDHKDEYKSLLNKRSVKSNEDVSNIFLSKILLLDLKDTETSSLIKEYEVDKIKILDSNEYLNDPYYLNIRVDDNDNKKDINFKINNDLYTLGYKSYEDKELFLYDEVETNKDNYYIEINKLGYFNNNNSNKPFKYLYLSKNNEIWMSIIPHEINTMKKDIINIINDLDSYLNHSNFSNNNSSNININIYIYGLGLGYFPYLLNKRIKEYLNKNKNNINKDINININVIEYDSNIIDIFNKFLKPEFIKNKININIINIDAKLFNDELINSINNNKNNINNNLNTYNIIYIDLWHTPIDSLKTYLYLKHNELNSINNSSNNTSYYYWIESSILMYLRRIIILIIYDLINIDSNSFINKYYKDLSSLYDIDPLFNINNISNIDDSRYLRYLEYKIYSYLIGMDISDISDIKSIISDEGILNIIKNIDV